MGREGKHVGARLVVATLQAGGKISDDAWQMIFELNLSRKKWGGLCSELLSTVEPRFHEPLYNEVLGITNDIRSPAKVTVKCMEQNLDITKSLL